MIITKKCISCQCEMPKVCGKYFNYKSSLMTLLKARYSAFADDNVTFFLVFHDMGEDPCMIKYPVKERRVIGHVARSKSQ